MPKAQGYPFNHPTLCHRVVPGGHREFCQTIREDRQGFGCLAPTIVHYYSPGGVDPEGNSSLVTSQIVRRCGRACVVLSDGERLVAYRQHVLVHPNDVVGLEKTRLYGLTIVRGELDPAAIAVVPGAREPSPPLPHTLCVQADGTPAQVQPYSNPA